MMTTLLRLATRQSPLALWQAHYVKQQLQMAQPHLQIELVPLLTAGDKNTDIALTELGGKSLFVKELQNALLQNKADIAVHSIKDMSVIPCPGLILAAVCQREDARDVLIAPNITRWQDLPTAAVIGTASPRRQCQLLAHRPDLIVKPLRGNVGTRLAKLNCGDFAALILAGAGLKRLGLTAHISQYLPIEEFIPAIGQGALGIECREADQHTRRLLASLNDWNTQQCVIAERAVNFRLGGDCYTPIGAYAQIQASQLILRGLIGSTDGRLLLTATHQGHVTAAEKIGLELAEKLLAQGAGELCCPR